MRKRLPESRPSPIDDRHSPFLLGAHMSIGGGVHRAIERARSIECSAMQIFVKNNMQWFARPFTGDEIKAFLDHPQRADLKTVFAHANYLINLAATNPQFHANSIRALSEELQRAEEDRRALCGGRFLHPDVRPCKRAARNGNDETFEERDFLRRGRNSARRPGQDHDSKC
jgi:hypothetical protein